MKFIETDLPGVMVLEPQVWKDHRGHFFEAVHGQKFKGTKVPPNFVQDNFSRSLKGVLRGMHTQVNRPQGKLVRAITGEIFDVVVDVRRDSATFGKWTGVILSGENFKSLYVPPGFLHGFCVLSETADVEYKCTDFYDPSDEMGICWNDPDLKINWPINNPVLSVKDAQLPTLAKMNYRLPE